MSNSWFDTHSPERCYKMG